MTPSQSYHRILINPFPEETFTMFDVKTIAVRAFVTAVQAVLAVLIAAGATNLSIETAQAAVVAGLGAVLSVLYNAANQWLAAHQSGGT